MSFTRNMPSPEGSEIGAPLARLTAAQFAELKKKFPLHKEPCGTCAFRAGTAPNRCVSTVMDAFKCVIEQTDFLCHETAEPKKLCTGWMIALSAVADKPPGKVPWDFSVMPEDAAIIDGERKRK